MQDGLNKVAASGAFMVLLSEMLTVASSWQRASSSEAASQSQASLNHDTGKEQPPSARTQAMSASLPFRAASQVLTYKLQSQTDSVTSIWRDFSGAVLIAAFSMTSCGWKPTQTVAEAPKNLVSQAGSWLRKQAVGDRFAVIRYINQSNILSLRYRSHLDMEDLAHLAGELQTLQERAVRRLQRTQGTAAVPLLDIMMLVMRGVGWRPLAGLKQQVEKDTLARCCSAKVSLHVLLVVL